MRPPSKNHVHKVKGSPHLHYIRIVPKDVREVIGKAKWRINLKTAIRAQADTLARGHDNDSTKEIEAARVRSGRVDILSGLSAEEREVVENSGGVQGYLEWLDRRAEEAAALGSRVETYREKPLRKEFLPYAYDPHGVPERDFEIDPEFVESETAALGAEQRTIQRQLGRHAKTVARLNAPAGPYLSEAIAKGLPDDEITLSGVLEKWKARNNPSAPEQYAYPVTMFESLHGALPVKAITSDHIRTFRDIIGKLPKAAGGKFKNMSMTAMIDEAERRNSPRLSDVTAQKYFRSIGTILSFAVDDNYLSENPVAGLKWRAQKQKFHAVEKSRRSLSPVEMQTLLDAAAQWGGKDGIENMWFARILAYTGCRPEELAQISIADVAMVGGVLCFRLHDEGANKLKTKSSLRDVPVHPQLIALGLNEFLATRSGAIFESLKPDGRGRLYTRMQHRLSAFMKNKAGLKDERVKPYSLRDSFIDSLRLVECPESIEDAIVGHARPERKVARGYGGVQLPVVAKWAAKADPLDERRTVSVAVEKDVR